MMHRQHVLSVLGIMFLSILLGCGSEGDKSLVNPSANNAATITPQSQQVNTAAPRLNPAHGQPGHRCDINVGAPLPIAGAVVQPTPTPTVTAPPVNNPTPSLNLPNGSAGIKINPAHGQPGHRCDIAVGAPIK